MRLEDTDGTLEAKRVEAARAANKTRTPFMLKPTEGWNRFSLDQLDGVDETAYINVRFINGRMYCLTVGDVRYGTNREPIAEWQFVQPVYVRWRAIVGEPYYAANVEKGVFVRTETGSSEDDVYHRLGNYWKTGDDAAEFYRRLLELIETVHTEIV